MDTEKIIDIKELDKSFGDIHAVNRLSFCVKKGELFAFLGVNGAGEHLLRKHALAGVFAEMETLGWPKGVLTEIKDAVDANFYFFGRSVSAGVMYAVLLGSVAALLGAYILLQFFSARKRAKQ